MGNIVYFYDDKENEILGTAEKVSQATSSVRFPTKKDVLDLKDRYDSYNDPDEMVAMCDWAGTCWRTLFDGMCTEFAEKYNEDPWDVFAALIYNLFENPEAKRPE